MKHTLFLVHGMGRHDADWWKKPWKQLCELSDTYKFFRNRQLEDLVEPVGITYDDELGKALTRWATEGSKFADFAAAQELRFADDGDWLRNLDDEEPGFELSHVADVIIYRFFKLEAARIRDQVKLEIARKVRERKAEDASARFSILAHSLGTAVVHDALAEFGRMPRIDDHPNTFRAGQFSFRSLHMVANVSRLAQTDPPVYDSIVRPGDRDSAVTYCLNYNNYRHELDPFLLVRPFRPVGFGPRFEDVSVKHVHDWNVHSFSHYLANPRVHVPILNAITRSSAIRRSEFGQRVETTPRFAGEFQGVQDFRDEVAELARLAQLLDEEKPLADNVDTFRKMWAVIGELKTIVTRELGR